MPRDGDDLSLDQPVITPVERDYGAVTVIDLFADDPRCDFCDRYASEVMGVWWTYTTNGEKWEVVIEGPPKWTFREEDPRWLACPTCAGFIEAEERDALHAFGYNVVWTRFGGEPPEGAFEFSREIQDNFFRTRLPGREVTPRARG